MTTNCATNVKPGSVNRKTFDRVGEKNNDKENVNPN
jgi:hypothetical protein